MPVTRKRSRQADGEDGIPAGGEPEAAKEHAEADSSAGEKSDGGAVTPVKTDAATGVHHVVRCAVTVLID